LRHESGWRSIRVPSVTLASLLQDLGPVDLIDMDIEGQELPVIRSTIQALDKQVKRLHIGTHGKEIEDELRRLLFAHEWSCWGRLLAVFNQRNTVGNDQLRKCRPGVGESKAF
jgi:hypothetical protein